jgi:uncharacterized protein YndB with AHSA1/START domain
MFLAPQRKKVMEQATAIQLETEKSFAVPVERLYTAWTSEEDLKQWWHPMENRLSALTNELEEGGKVAYRFETGGGEEAFSIDGVYKEVVPGKRLVYTWNWHLPADTVHDTEFLLTITFEEAEGGSRLHVRQDQFTSEEAVKPHREGWETALESLRQYLEGA